ncbi:hypothetical protein DQQ10_16090 [Pseudochryseolinea flava]|uniref:HMA domain-containing protein n=2 Tax=Pseudochryseolinea flava TaxID=2059302 RepID=A0A364Y0L2_9BACT|nr:hypothetical protein DQQ10_16090 [Pseudochryseolinea flava]
MNAVLVFKTNLNPSGVEDIAMLLSKDPRIKKWNVDLEDVDRILRVVSNTLTPMEVQHQINAAGYLCEELPD